jgi:single-stranded DNA-binding protein
MSFARITISGTLLQAPEKRFTQNNAGVSILQISVPMPPRRNQETPNLVVKVLCWRGLSDAVLKLPAGAILHVEGRLQINSVTTPEGVTKKMFEVDAQQIHQLPALPTYVQPESQQQGAYNNQAPAQQGYAPAPQQQPAYAQASYDAPQQDAGYGGQTAQAVATAPAVNLNTLSADDFLTEDDLPF